MLGLVRVLLGFLCGVALAVAYLFFTSQGPRRVSGPREPTPVVTGRGPGIPVVRPSPLVAVAVPPVRQTASLMLVVRLRGALVWDELFIASGGLAQSVSIPSTVDRTVFPVTDGRRLYAYTAPRGGDRRGRRLVAFSFDGREEEVITDSTRLVTPRGLFVSLDGRTLAYFLDDRTSEKTELWAYDTVERTKRVIVERLERGELRGPFFSPDGTVLLHDGREFLTAAPNRTGVDPVRVNVRVADIDWDAGVLRSPDGTQLALVVSEDGIEYGTRLVAYRVGGAGEPLTSVERGRTHLLRWTAEEGVVFAVDAEGEKAPVVLSVTPGNAPRTARLPLGGVGPILSGSARTVVSIVQGGVRPVIKETDLRSGVSRVVSTVPAPTDADSGEPALRLVQVFSSAEQFAGDTRVVSALPADVVVSFVTAHLRAITDAPPGESVVAERLWVLQQPRVYYLDYRIGTTLWRRLIALEGETPDALHFSVRGVFAPVQGEWALTRGEGASDPTPVALYEYEPEVNRWVEKRPVGQSGLVEVP